MKTIDLTIFDDDNCEVNITVEVEYIKSIEDFNCTLTKNPKTNMSIEDMEAKAVEHLRIYPEKYFN